MTRFGAIVTSARRSRSRQLPDKSGVPLEGPSMWMKEEDDEFDDDEDFDDDDEDDDDEEDEDDDEEWNADE